MARLYLLLAFLVWPLLVLSQAYNYGIGPEWLVPRWDNTSRVIIGRLPRRIDGSVPLRREIRQMQKDPYMWELFVLGLNMMQNMDQEDQLSYYQVAGIHGVPFMDWNQVPPVPGGAQSGYCMHSSVLFPMWHRPYLALLEEKQQLYNLVNRIAKLYLDPLERNIYMRAAADFRLPYWDWAATAPVGEKHFPEIFWNPSLLQNGPNGIQKIKNPLYSYQFHPLYEGVMPWTPLKYWNETKRAPDMLLDIIDPPSINEEVDKALLGKLSEIQQRLFILFSSYKNFNAFSNKAAAIQQGLSTWDSIESVHDIIHIYGGLKGHMTYVPLSSFDPLFFLHHANTDRLVAMWQALNPTSWITPMAAGETSYTGLKGTIQTSTTPLTPFLATTQGDYWTSDTARLPEMFGYSYPETDVSYRTVGQMKVNLVRDIVRYYGLSSPVGLRVNSKFASGRPSRIKLATSMDWQSETLPINLKEDSGYLEASTVFRENNYTEWVANVRVNVEALDGLFGVHFFFGDPPLDSAAWDSSGNHIGSVGIFAMNRNTGSESKISGTLPLTTALIKLVAVGGIPNLSPKAVEPFLRQSLRFSIRGSDNRITKPQSVDGLFIVITSSEVTSPQDQSELPTWGESVQRFEVWS